ncbi:Structural maintenance of chromosomes protein 6, partial [Cryomyces antarcticus]
NKRQRLSTVNDDASSDVEVYDSAGRHEGTSDQDNLFQETRRTTCFEDLGNEDADDARATQLVGRHFREPKQNTAADNGIIEEVECFNFMCHTHLRVKLGPLINFIIGHNGSGKSAVLTALTLCLGAKAISTNRGGSLKSFIKEGQENARLLVKIKNLGDNAYQPELYGRSITVERHFSMTGASGFKIKSADQRIISTKKADLEDIADCF